MLGEAELCLTSLGARTRLRRKVSHLPHAASGAPQEKAARAQEAPQPPAKRRFSGASVLTAVLPELVRWLPATAAGSMRQTCQGLLPALDATRARIADSIARACQALLPALQDPLASALLQAGLSSAEVLAMRAQAWRWLGQCNQHMLSSAECW